MKVVNLTPHTVTLLTSNQEVIASFPSQGSVRVGMENSYELVNGIPIGKTSYTSLEGLPESKEDTLYILSSIAFNAAKAAGRKDICFPSGKMYRNKEGQIIGVEFLSTDN